MHPDESLASAGDFLFVSDPLLSPQLNPENSTDVESDRLFLGRAIAFAKMISLLNRNY